MATRNFGAGGWETTSSRTAAECTWQVLAPAAASRGPLQALDRGPHPRALSSPWQPGQPQVPASPLKKWELWLCAWHHRHVCSWKHSLWKWKSLSCVRLLQSHGHYSPWEFSRPQYRSGQPFPSPGESSQPRDQTQVSCIAGGFFTSWAIREAPEIPENPVKFQHTRSPWTREAVDEESSNALAISIPPGEFLWSISHIECEQGASLKIVSSSIFVTPQSLRKHLVAVEMRVLPFPVGRDCRVASEAFTSIRVCVSPCLSDCGSNFVYIPPFGLKMQSQLVRFSHPCFRYLGVTL